MTMSVAVFVPVAVFVLVGMTSAVATAVRVVVQRVQRLHRASRLRRSLSVDLPPVAEGVARSLVAGVSLPAAMRDAVAAAANPTTNALDAALGDYDRGLSIERAMQRLVERTPAPDLRLFVAAVSLAHGPTGPQPALFDRVALDLRARANVRAEATTQAAQARASAIVVGALPWLVCVVIAIGGGPVAARLFGTSFGLALLGVALLLECVGVGWMLTVTRRVLS